MAHIRLVREGLELKELNGQQTWPLKVTASVIDAAMPSDKIFVYHSAMTDDAYEGDLFECVASIQQYNDLPVNTPVFEGKEDVVPYYRSNILYFACRSPEEADELWDDVEEDVTDLINNYVALNNLTTSETTDI